MKIHAYRVVQKGPRPFEEVLNRLNDLPHGQRFFQGSAVGLRLDSFSVKDGLVFADIALARVGHGPARMPLHGPMSEIDLAEGERFGEDTGLVYDPASRYMALQYNHIGPRIQRIQAYFIAADLSFGGLGPSVPGQTDFDRCGYSFGAVLKPDAYDRLGRMGIVRKFEFAISLPGARSSDRDLGRSLGQVLNAPLPDGVETLEITMKAAPAANSRLSRSTVMSMVQGLQSISPFVRSAMVRGKRDEDATVENINLIEEQLEREALVTLGRGHRYPRSDRWDAIEGTLLEWLGNGSLPRGE